MAAPAVDQRAANISTLAAEAWETTPNRSEWEYEYDDNETEDYYFTLDVTVPQEPSTQNSKQKARRRISSSVINGAKRTESANAPTITGAESTSSNSNLAQPSSTITEALDRRLQVLDLDSENPLVLLDGQLYSCSWATDLGSQFYITHAGVAEKPLRPGCLLDVVGLSRTRLIGRPVAIRERKIACALDVGASAEKAITIDEDHNDEDQDDDVGVTIDTPDETSLRDVPTSTELFARQRRAAIDPGEKAHASFLERLSAIKEQKGEIDSIPFNGVKNYSPPSNQDEVRKRAIAADAEISKNATPAPTQNGKRGPYKNKHANTTEDTAAAPEKKRKKPGPQSNLAISSSLGLPEGITPVGSTSLIDPHLVHTSPPSQASSPPNG